MEAIEKAYYKVKFENVFLTYIGNEFQAFFNNIMRANDPYFHIPTRTWGQSGDQKCDGYNLKTGAFFQIYAPDDMVATTAISKMKEDFDGAFEKWGKDIKTWVFVHNAKHDSLATHIIHQLIEFKKNHPDIVFCQMGKKEIGNILFQLNENEIKNILGSTPTNEDIKNLNMEAIQRVIDNIARSPIPQIEEILPVSQKKLDANDLSDSVKLLLETGMKKSGLISSFFAQWHDPSLGEKVAAEMNNMYKSIVIETRTPDEVYYKLYQMLDENTDDGKKTENMIAILTLLSYFFQTCDIFEHPRES